MKRALMIIGLAVAMTGASFAVQAEETDVAKVKCSEFIQDKESMGMLLMWLDGYASQKSDNTVLSDEWIEKLGAHMGKYCSENLTQLFLMQLRLWKNNRFNGVYYEKITSFSSSCTSINRNRQRCLS